MTNWDIRIVLWAPNPVLFASNMLDSMCFDSENNILDFQESLKNHQKSSIFGLLRWWAKCNEIHHFDDKINFGGSGWVKTCLITQIMSETCSAVSKYH